MEVRLPRLKSQFGPNLLPLPTIPAWSSVGEPFSDTLRESAPPVALLGIEEPRRACEGEGGDGREREERKKREEKWD